MRNRRKRAQREEVRKILHAMRLELAAQRLAQIEGRPDVLRVHELLSRVRGAV